MKEILPEKQPPHRVDEHHVRNVYGAMKISAEPAFMRKVRDMIIDRKITPEHTSLASSHTQRAGRVPYWESQLNSFS